MSFCVRFSSFKVGQASSYIEILQAFVKDLELFFSPLCCHRDPLAKLWNLGHCGAFSAENENGFFFFPGK